MRRPLPARKVVSVHFRARGRLGDLGELHAPQPRQDLPSEQFRAVDRFGIGPVPLIERPMWAMTAPVSLSRWTSPQSCRRWGAPGYKTTPSRETSPSSLHDRVRWQNRSPATADRGENNVLANCAYGLPTGRATRGPTRPRPAESPALSAMAVVALGRATEHSAHPRSATVGTTDRVGRPGDTSSRSGIPTRACRAEPRTGPGRSLGWRTALTTGFRLGATGPPLQSGS
jgi:hypothetical protein